MKKQIIFMLLMSVSLLVAMNKNVRISGEAQIIEFNNSDYRIIEAEDYFSIDADNGHVSEKSGAPNLPHFLFQVSTPQNHTPNIELNILESRIITLSKDIQPIPFVERRDGMSHYTYKIDPSQYQIKKSNLEVIPNQNFRRISFAEVIINPFLYNYEAKTLEVIIRAELVVLVPNTKGSQPTLDKFEQAFAKDLTNPQAIHTLKSRARTINYADFTIANHWYKIDISQNGIHALSYNNLKDILPVNDIDPRNIRIFSTGGKQLWADTLDNGYPFREIPLLIEGEADGSFDVNDRIIFYARNRNGYDFLSKLSSKMSINPYSDNSVYWLSYDAVLDSLPLRMEQENAPASYTVTRNNNPQNSRYEREYYKRNQTNLFWYSNFFTGSSTSTHNFDLEVSDLDLSDNNTNSILKTAMIEEMKSTAVSSTRHDLSLSLNGTLVSQNNNWYGSDYNIIKKQATTLTNGSNSVGLIINRTFEDNIYLDYIELQYLKKNVKKNGSQLGINFHDEDLNKSVRYAVEGDFSANTRVFSANNIYEVTALPYSIDANKLYFTGTVPEHLDNKSDNFISKFYVTNNDYLTATIARAEPQNIISQASNKESIIIYPEEFSSQAQRLKVIYESLYESPTACVSQADIFVQFNGGMDDPAAIRNFLRHLYNSDSRNALKYVTLLGSGSYDWKGYKSNSVAKNKLIIFQNGNNYPGDAITSDDYFVYLTQDRKPELAIGRYPVINSSQLDLMIDKFEAYSNKEFDIDWWRNTAISIADDFKNGSATNEIKHTTELNNAARNITPSMIQKRIYAFQYEPDEFGKKPTTRNDFIADLNEGALITFYSGHGSHDQLGTEAYFRQGIDTPQLTNDAKRTFFISASCDVSQFDSPDFDCLSADLLKYNLGGAIATFGSTRLCYMTPNNTMSGNLLYYTTNSRENIGTAIMLTKTREISSAINQSKYVLFGDPHLEIIPPLSRRNIVFDDNKTSFQARETVRFSGNMVNSNIQTAKILAFQSHTTTRLDTTDVLIPGSYIFNGETSVSNSNYSAAFVVPDDIIDGSLGKIIVYGYDNSSQEEVLDYYYPVEFAGHDYFVENTSAPEISIWLESYDFREGDIVSQNPLLLVDLSDENGINVSGGSGHRLLLMVDNDFNSFDITPFFNYDLDSYQSGKIEYQITDLAPGNHFLKILAFDNLNKPAVKTVSFTVSKASELSLSDVLPYPNPMSKRGGDFTFMISTDALIQIDLYTITGKKINTLKASVSKGFNSLSWDGRDKRGDKLANNTYFYIIKATAEGKTVTKREKFIILD
ncbi:MAG: type IX secretion system sortase PorU [Candidatus Cloacimonadales bacterium]